MTAKNGVQLITYIDRFGGKTLDDLQSLLSNELKDVFTGLHLLPFYYPIDGADAGFDPIDHTIVDKRLGEWHQVASLGDNFDIMADMVVNHVSAKSDYFQDVLKYGEKSEYWPLFLRQDSVFDNAEDPNIKNVFRPRPTPFFSNYELANGQTVPFWTTFTSNQIDIDVESEKGQAYLDSILSTFSKNNIKLIRLDAAGYAIKRPGTNCFMLEETFEFIQELSTRAAELEMQCLVEIHSHYETQIEIAKRCDAVYDFALPPLVLHTLFTKDASALTKWLGISPRNCYTVLDTHDGIGIVDVGASNGKPGLLDHNEINELVETIHNNSSNESRKATGASASNVDLYQVNCTFYDALAKDDSLYLIARAIQFFCPGIPQVYYAGFLACENDMSLLKKTNVGRDINRPYISNEDLKANLTKPVVRALRSLIEIRNNASAFDGEFTFSYQDNILQLHWANSDDVAKLSINLENSNAAIQIVEDNEISEYDLLRL